MENSACPRLVERIKGEIQDPGEFIEHGKIIIPENLANGLKLNSGDEVVLVANNKDGSVNGVSLTVSHIIEGLVGPSGRDGFVHLADAKTLLRISGSEINEVIIRLMQRTLNARLELPNREGRRAWGRDDLRAALRLADDVRAATAQAVAQRIH